MQIQNHFKYLFRKIQANKIRLKFIQRMGNFSMLLKNFVLSSPQQKKFKCKVMDSP